MLVVMIIAMALRIRHANGLIAECILPAAQKEGRGKG